MNQSIKQLIKEIVNCFCGLVDRWKGFSLISSPDHCQRSSPSRISDTPRAGIEPAQNLSSGLVEWSCAVVITPQRHMERDSCFSKYQSQGCRDEDLHFLTSLTDKINKKIEVSYFLNLSNQLNGKCVNPKKYWILLRSFYNGIKVPLIPPILKGNKYVSDFKEKANYFNEFLSLHNVLPLLTAQCFLINRITASFLDWITIFRSDILKTISSLDINKSHDQ